jgi:hypothetical protein
MIVSILVIIAAIFVIAMQAQHISDLTEENQYLREMNKCLKHEKKEAVPMD